MKNHTPNFNHALHITFFYIFAHYIIQPVDKSVLIVFIQVGRKAFKIEHIAEPAAIVFVCEIYDSFFKINADPGTVPVVFSVRIKTLVSFCFFLRGYQIFCVLEPVFQDPVIIFEIYILLSSKFIELYSNCLLTHNKFRFSNSRK